MNPSCGLWAVLLLAPWSADRPAQPALHALVDPPKAETHRTEAAACGHHGGGRRCRACRSAECQPCPQAFVLGDTRYEPRLRDIRLVPSARTLPGSDVGLGETLPALPPRKAGYFRLPAW